MIKTKHITASSRTTHISLMCTQFSEDDIADRDYQGEYIMCMDMNDPDDISIDFVHQRTEEYHPLRVAGPDARRRDKLRLFILNNFDDLEDVTTITPRDWDRVIENL